MMIELRKRKLSYKLQLLFLLLLLNAPASNSQKIQSTIGKRWRFKAQQEESAAIKIEFG